MNIPTSTPWGDPQTGNVLAPGIVEFSTARHGGIWLSDERLAALPPGLRGVATFNNLPNWFEEDCDRVLVVFAFPALFSPQDCWNAIEFARVYVKATFKPYPLAAACNAFLGTPAAAPVLARAKEFEDLEKPSEKWQRGSMGGNREGWTVNFHRGDKSRRVLMADYPAQQFYTDAELDALEIPARQFDPTPEASRAQRADPKSREYVRDVSIPALTLVEARALALTLKPVACEKFNPLVNGGDYRGTICVVCGATEAEHAVAKAGGRGQ
jgi:hypothetical protein